MANKRRFVIKGRHRGVFELNSGPSVFTLICCVCSILLIQLFSADGTQPESNTLLVRYLRMQQMRKWKESQSSGADACLSVIGGVGSWPPTFGGGGMGLGWVGWGCGWVRTGLSQKFRKLYEIKRMLFWKDGVAMINKEIKGLIRV